MPWFPLRVPARLRPHYLAELRAATAAQQQQDPARARHHLERAHVLGQRWALSHTHVHGRLLAWGLRNGSFREVAGQLPRLVFGFVGSLIGRVPVGNTGGADVPAEQPMPIAPDLQALLALMVTTRPR